MRVWSFWGVGIRLEATMADTVGHRRGGITRPISSAVASRNPVRTNTHTHKGFLVGST